MATDLTAIFGSEIKVAASPRAPRRQYAGFAGAHGMTCMHLGSRGFRMLVSGTLRAAGANYNAARIALQAIINTIEAYQWAAMASYTYRGGQYDYMVFEKFRLVPDSRGKVFHFTAGGYVTCNFTCLLQSLV